MDTKCRLTILLLSIGYIVYLVALFTPRLGEYIARATIAVLVGLLVYLFARYLAAQCRHPRENGSDILKTPVG